MTPFSHILVTVPAGALTPEQERQVRDVAQRLADALADANAELQERDRRIDILEAAPASRPEAPMDEVSAQRLRAWAEQEAGDVACREAAAKHAEALNARRAIWADTVERLAPFGARLDDDARTLVLRITDPEQADRIAAALTPNAREGEETET